MSLDRLHRRSVAFLERDGETWSCFLVTFRDRSLQWHGYFSFRPRDGELEEDEIRTADIFLESSEEEIDRKARELGRPLLNGLLSSALHTAEQNEDRSPRLRRRFREMLSESSRELVDTWEPPSPDVQPGEDRTGEDRTEEAELARLRSLYESYRLDQVAHFICLVRPAAFEAAVDRILEGRSVDFGARDRLQFAMMVVEYVEERLPLPPFDVWLRDYLDHSDAYRLYAHTLHREGRLP